MVTFTINIPPMLAYIPYMDPMGIESHGFGDSTFQEPPILQNPVQMKQPTSCFPIRAEALDDLIVFEIRYSDCVGHREK
jgi:hypothetical protein